MAGAVRPVVLLMLLASLLFVVDGVLDGVYPGGGAWFTGKYENLAEVAYVFALLNTLVAVLVARGSERSLVARIGLSAFFLLERPITAFALGPKPAASVAVHFGTALVELVILGSALRIWRLGRSVPSDDLDTLFALETPPPAPASEREEIAPPPPPVLSARSSWLLGVLTLLLAGVFVADGMQAGFVPGGRGWGVTGEASGWLVYLFAVVALVVSARAVHGGRLALRLLFSTALIFFIERAFSPLALKVVDPIALALHGLAAILALALALATAAAIRASRARSDGGVATLEAA